MQNGSDWYWEVITQDRDVIARGIATSHTQARTDAENALRRETPIYDLKCPDDFSASNPAAAGRYIRFAEERNLRLGSI
jgi:hypothetical protein